MILETVIMKRLTTVTETEEKHTKNEKKGIETSRELQYGMAPAKQNANMNMMLTRQKEKKERRERECSNRDWRWLKDV